MQKKKNSDHSKNNVKAQKNYGKGLQGDGALCLLFDFRRQAPPIRTAKKPTAVQMTPEIFLLRSASSNAYELLPPNEDIKLTSQVSGVID